MFLVCCLLFKKTIIQVTIIINTTQFVAANGTRIEPVQNKPKWEIITKNNVQNRYFSKRLLCNTLHILVYVLYD